MVRVLREADAGPRWRGWRRADGWRCHVISFQRPLVTHTAETLMCLRETVFAKGSSGCAKVEALSVLTFLIRAVAQAAAGADA